MCTSKLIKLCTERHARPSRNPKWYHMHAVIGLSKNAKAINHLSPDKNAGAVERPPFDLARATAYHATGQFSETTAACRKKEIMIRKLR